MTHVLAKGTCVTVTPNTNSLHIPDHYEPTWTGIIETAYETPINGGSIVSYDVAPDTGGLPRNVLAFRANAKKSGSIYVLDLEP